MLPHGSTMRSVKNLLTSGRRTAAAMVLESFCATGSGTPAGASTPNHATAWNPGTVSAMAGRSGTTGIRLGDVTAR